MGQLLAGKTALVTGVANKWSIAYAIASAFVREDATLILTYQSERQRQTVEELGADLKAAKIFVCDATQAQDLERLAPEIKVVSDTRDILVHSIAFANNEHLSR